MIGEIGSSSVGEVIEYQFDGLGTYTVDLYVHNTDGCFRTTSEELELRPTIVLNSDPYLEDFNDEQGLWTVNSDSTEISWTWGTPDFTGFVPEHGNQGWYTDFPEDEVAYSEHSWIQSPCFDFSGIPVPMIQLDMMRSFVPVSNGAVLQYQDVIDEGWITIGEVGSGIDWYSSDEISNEPGGSSTGWGLEVFNPDTDWVSARHDLDELKGKKHVSFRLAIATTGAQVIGNQGFAFDNVRISKRTKRIVLEHFTNSGSANAKLADDIVDEMAAQFPGNVIDLQYHVNTPGFDQMNENNPYPPATRVNVNGILEVPYTILDGGIVPGHRFDYEDLASESFEKQVRLSTLETPLFDVELEVDWAEPELTATTRVTSKGSYSDNILLFVVVMEKEVTAYSGTNGDLEFRNVVLDMLPITGILLGGNWYEGKTEERTHQWPIAKYVEDFEDLAIVAFIQDRNEPFRRLHSTVNYASGPVGIADRHSDLAEMVVYPNPASSEFFVNLGDRAEADGRLELIDMRGQLVHQAEVPMGYQLIQLNIDRLNPGLYMVRYMEGNQFRGMSKVIKTR